MTRSMAAAMVAEVAKDDSEIFPYDIARVLGWDDLPHDRLVRCLTQKKKTARGGGGRVESLEGKAKRPATRSNKPRSSYPLPPPASKSPEPYCQGPLRGHVHAPVSPTGRNG